MMEMDDIYPARYFVSIRFYSTEILNLYPIPDQIVI